MAKGNSSEVAVTVSHRQGFRKQYHADSRREENVA